MGRFYLTVVVAWLVGVVVLEISLGSVWMDLFAGENERTINYYVIPLPAACWSFLTKQTLRGGSSLIICT